MKIERLKVNHMENPVGFELGQPDLSFVVEESSGSFARDIRVLVAKDETFRDLAYDSGKSSEIDSRSFLLPILLEPRTRYYWKVFVTADNGEEGCSKTAFFETAKLTEKFLGSFIACKNREINCKFYKEIHTKGKIKKARLYICGLGVYECQINGEKAGREYLMPGFCDYDSWLPYQTYDVSELFNSGKNELAVYTGDGWYKGRFGFEGGVRNIYGDRQAIWCELHITYEDGREEITASDESFLVYESKVRFSDIYDGEIYDACYENATVYEAEQADIPMERLAARRGLLLVQKETIEPVALLQTPAGETVLDMGQNMAGFLRYYCREEKGTSIKLQFGEILQDGNFYRENLREAKAEFVYISDGQKRWIRPHFTYYGFRYVKISGCKKEISLKDFKGCVIYSDMEQTGELTTSNPLVNRLIENARWGQKGNFIDVPTDCPQRDERLGWTGDAQVFCGTASYFMDTYAFYSKYGFDMGKEQKKNNGAVPQVVPSIKMKTAPSSAWADAATIIPWTVYLFSGDKQILVQQYESMKSWVDYIQREDEKAGGKRLFQTGFHFGDWLALDGEDPAMPTGRTEITYIASCYYYYSATIVSKAAEVIGRDEDAKDYRRLADEIKKAIQEEYFTKNGRLALDTQTAYILALQFGLVPKVFEDRAASDLMKRLKKDQGFLKTGFVGTPYLCQVLSRFGKNDEACRLLLNQECPGWLYPVTMGATTIWERWNSVLPDGKINPEGMNSLNHYSYGSIVEWMFRYLLGINPTEEAPGFRHVRLTPMPSWRLKEVQGSYRSACGTYEVSWKVSEDKLSYRFKIPFGASATAVLPDAPLCSVFVNGERMDGKKYEACEKNGKTQLILTAGVYEISYPPYVPYVRYHSVKEPLHFLLSDERAKAVLEDHVKGVRSIPPQLLKNLGQSNLEELMDLPFFQATEEELEAAEKDLAKIKIEA